MYSEVCIDRHLVCEPCGPTVAGGYDPSTQQVGSNVGDHKILITGYLVHARLFCVRTTYILKDI